MKSSNFNNIKFYIGQSASENWDLLDIAKSINPEYIWFHLNSFPSPYVIMYASQNNIIDKQDKTELTDYLEYGATLCKANSKYKNLKDLKVLCLPVKKLTKSNTIGEVIISGKRKTIKL